MAILSILLIIGGLFLLGVAYHTYKTADEEGYIRFRYRGVEARRVAHFEFFCPTVFILTGIAVAYYAWRIYQEE